MPTLQIPRRLEKILTTKARIIVVVGGRSSGKSEGVGRILLMKAQTEEADILCGREYQNSIEDSVHKLLTSLIDKLGVQGVASTDRKIDFNDGGGFRYKGFARNSSAVKSAQDFKYSWVEEAQDLSKQSIKDLLPTIRASGSKLIFTGNPQASNDPFSERFIVPFMDDLLKTGIYEDDMHLVIMANWRDNPWHGELEQQRLWDKEHLSRAEYDHIWEGAFNDDVENSVIKAEWFDCAVDAHKQLGFKPTGIQVVSHDPSDLGPDPKGLVYRHGSVIMDIQENKTGDANEGCDWALDYAIDIKADLFSWDCDGMGVALKRQVTQAIQGKHIDYLMFKGSESPSNPHDIYQPVDGEKRSKAKTNQETFLNKRAQNYWRLHDRFYNTYLAIDKGVYINPDEMISINSEISCLAQFRSEICRVPRKPNGNGKIQIMTKKEMREKYKIKSPNLADSGMMSLEVLPPMTEIQDFTIPKRKGFR